MALRIEKTVGVILLAAASLTAGELSFNARHEHFRKGCPGVLRIGEDGIAFDAAPSKKPHSWRWTFSDIQQLKIEPRRLTVLTYEDRKWHFGTDRSVSFTLTDGGSFKSAYAPLWGRMDQRLVVAIADTPAGALWSVPVKRAGRLKGAEGRLVVGTDSIVFETAEPRGTRVWRLEDIDNISSAGPFELTVTTHERSRTDYGSLKSFHFQLKQALAEDRYNDLWWRINQNRIRRIQ